MTEFIDVLRVGQGSDSGKSCLKKYMDKRESQTRKKLQPSEARIDFEVFQESVLNLSSQIQEFIDTNERKRSFLVLGQVQSGKTAHLLANVAWASDSQIATAAILTGVTNPLNEQTINRVTRDLVSLGDHFIKIFRVPTSSKGSEFNSLMSNVRNHVQWRLQTESDVPRPIPVFVMIKKKARIDTLAEIYRRLEREFGREVVNLLIDDEADQATPNARAFKRETAQTYAAISSALETDSRVVLLSYTATPQAVLLAEKKGNLQPDRCVIVPPRKGYFGLREVVAKEFESNRVEVNDWNVQARDLRTRPRSLERALLDFFILAWVRFNFPRGFYSGALSTDDLTDRLKSVQMLIHESSRQMRHTKMYQFVEKYKSDLVVGLRTILGGPKEHIGIGIRELGLVESIERLRSCIEIPDDVFEEEGALGDLFSLINSCCLKVVNASSDRPNREMELPSDDQGWEIFRTWILIGGDILGRGLTIPQLITTYFLRSAQKPNFDTVAQQMRFCGYRGDYARTTFLHATDDTFSSFEYMNMINTVVWNMAKRWDEKRLDLKKSRPQIMYATSTKINMEACRKSVRDPDLQDIRIDGETIFSARDIYRPIFVRQNLKTLQEWMSSTSSIEKSWEDWSIFENVQTVELQRLMSEWELGLSEMPRIRAATEIFDEILGELGLSDSNITIATRQFVRKVALGSHTEIERFLESTKIFRKNLGSTELSGLSEWKKATFQKSIDSRTWPKLQTHIGDEQRSLRDKLTASALLIVEPVIGTKIKRDRQSGVCAGLAFTLLAPRNFEIQILGHN